MNTEFSVIILGIGIAISLLCLWKIVSLQFKKYIRKCQAHAINLHRDELCRNLFIDYQKSVYPQLTAEQHDQCIQSLACHFSREEIDRMRRDIYIGNDELNTLLKQLL